MSHLSLASTHYPRLPMLHSIGRCPGIDLEEPPPETETEEDELELLKASRNCSVQNIDSVFKKLNETFSVSNPGFNYCNKFDSSKWSNFNGILHCWKGAEVAGRLKQIDMLMVKRNILEMQRQMSCSLLSGSNFKEFLVLLLKKEHKMWSNICANRVSEAVKTNLTWLMELCEEMRIQLNQPESIWNSLYCNPRFKQFSRDAYSMMARFEKKFDALNRVCLRLMGSLIRLGFVVLGHCDLDRVDYEQLCNISKGIELYNHLVTKFNTSNNQSLGSFTTGSSPLHLPNLSISFLLSIVSRERSKYAAMACKDYLFGSDDVINLCNRVESKCHVDWHTMSLHESLLLNSLDTATSWHDFQFHNIDNPLSTHHDSRSSTPIQSKDEVLNSIEKIFTYLSSSYPPITDFVRRERSFIENFFHSICHVTTILHSDFSYYDVIDDNDGDGGNCENFNLTNMQNTQLDNKVQTPCCRDKKTKSILKNTAPCNDQGSESNNTDATASTTERHRMLRSIHWNDAVMSQRVNHLSINYFNTIWINFQQQLHFFLHSPSFLSQLSPSFFSLDFPSLGPVQILTDTSRILICKTLQAAATKGAPY